MNIGFSGHQNAPDQALTLMRDKLQDLINSAWGTHGFCSLAAGGDQQFAEFLLENGGELHVVVPCQGYEGTFDRREDRVRYERLLERSGSVTILPFPRQLRRLFLQRGLL